MKKIGLSISDVNYERIVEIAKENNLTPTTVCRLLIESKLQWYELKKIKPTFVQRYYERYRPIPIQQVRIPVEEPETEINDDDYDEDFINMAKDIFGINDDNTRTNTDIISNTDNTNNIDNSGD